MADSFGLKIGLEGEKEFKKALSDINQSFKVLGSEMKLVQSQFSKNDDSAEALAARTKTLTIKTHIHTQMRLLRAASVSLLPLLNQLSHVASVVSMMPSQWFPSTFINTL